MVDESRQLIFARNISVGDIISTYFVRGRDADVEGWPAADKPDKPGPRPPVPPKPQPVIIAVEQTANNIDTAGDTVAVIGRTADGTPVGYQFELLEAVWQYDAFPATVSTTGGEDDEDYYIQRSD